jgi:hypothetical protein
MERVEVAESSTWIEARELQKRLEAVGAEAARASSKSPERPPSPTGKRTSKQPGQGQQGTPSRRKMLTDEEWKAERAERASKADVYAIHTDENVPPVSVNKTL